MQRCPSFAQLGVLLLSSMLGLLPSLGFAQSPQEPRSEGQFGIGAQAGRPSGLAAKLYRHAHLGYDLAIVWDLNDFFFANVHRVHERALPNSPLHFFIGPGLFAGVDDAAGENDVTFGISGNFGLNFFKERFEVYLQATPRLRVYSDIQGRLGGGVGLRYYF